MKFIRRIFRLSLLLCASLAAPAVVAADLCSAVLEHAGRNYMSRFSTEQRAAWVYSHQCRSESASAGVGILIKSVPLSGNLANTEEWCAANRRYDGYFGLSSVIESTVSVPALAAWASCMQAKRSDLDIDHRLTPDGHTVQLELTNRGRHQERLTGVVAHTAEGGGLACTPVVAGDQSVALPINTGVLVDCKRTYMDVRRGGEQFRVLPAGSVTVITSLASHLYSFPEVFDQGTTPPETIPRRLVVSINGQHKGTLATWANGAHSQLLTCFPRPAPGPDFELVVLQESNFPSYQRGICGTPPYCDSAGEGCREHFYSRGCYINKEWHDWYKEDGLRRGVPYSKESVCG